MEKNINELTVKDFEISPVWYFPMDETVEDENSIIPASQTEVDYEGQMIVETDFVTNNDIRYKGFIYWEDSSDVTFAKPNLFIDNEWISIHLGGFISEEKIQSLMGKMKDLFPISFKSKEAFGLRSISGIIDGLYYFDMKSSTHRLIRL